MTEGGDQILDRGADQCLNRLLALFHRPLHILWHERDDALFDLFEDGGRIEGGREEEERILRQDREHLRGEWNSSPDGFEHGDTDTGSEGDLVIADHSDSRMKDANPGDLVDDFLGPWRSFGTELIHQTEDLIKDGR